MVHNICWFKTGSNLFAMSGIVLNAIIASCIVFRKRELRFAAVVLLRSCTGIADLPLEGDCSDVQGWHDAAGKSCKWYLESGVCNGSVVTLWEGSVGYMPELNCCICGRAQPSLTRTVALARERRSASPLKLLALPLRHVVALYRNLEPGLVLKTVARMTSLTSQV